MVDKNFVTDFGGVFANWNAYIGDVAQAGLEINLTIPAGTFQFGDITSPTQHLAEQYGAGQKINMYGAGIGVTTLYAENYGAKWSLDQFVRPALGGPQPRIETVLPGQSTITLTDPGTFLGDFDVGRWVMVNGGDPQGEGFPPNPIYWEFRKIISIDGAVLTLNEPLVNTYKSTWPLWHDPTGGTDTGGPASAFAMSTAWDAEMYITDCSINVPGGWYGVARTEWFNNVDFGNEPSIASLCVSSKYTNCTFHRIIEIDKGTEYLEYTNCTIGNLQVQSRACAGRLVMNDCTVSSAGVPENGEFTNCDFGTLFANLPGYGFTDSATFDNCWINPSDDFNLGYGFIAHALISLFTYDSDTGKFTSSFDDFVGADNGPFRGFQPGATLYLLALNNIQGFNTICGPFFEILDVEYDGVDTVTISTNLHQVDRLNRIASATGIGNHPCPSWTVSDGTGLLSAFSNPNGAGRPLGSYYYSGLINDFSTPGYSPGDGGTVYGPSQQLAGFLTKVEIIVTKPYTGVVSDLKGGVVASISNVFDADLAAMAYVPLVKLSVAGTRTMTPGSTVGTQTGDTGLDFGTDSFATWKWSFGVHTGDLATFIAEDPSVWPEFSIEIFADQELSEEEVVTANPLIARGLALSNFRHH